MSILNRLRAWWDIRPELAPVPPVPPVLAAFGSVTQCPACGATSFATEFKGSFTAWHYWHSMPPTPYGYGPEHLKLTCNSCGWATRTMTMRGSVSAGGPESP